MKGAAGVWGVEVEFGIKSCSLRVEWAVLVRQRTNQIQITKSNSSIERSWGH